MSDLFSFARVVEGVDHAECVVWGDAGEWYAGGEAGQIYRAHPDGALDLVAHTGGRPLGLALDAAGRLYVCDGGRNAVLRIDPATGAAETYSRGSAARRLRLPNFPAFAADGTLYVTASGGRFAGDGAIFRIAPGGTTEVWCEEVRRFPNGCCLSRDGDALFVVETDGCALNRIPIEPGGRAGRAELVAALPPGVPDGVALSVEGDLFVATCRPDGILRVTLDGMVDVVAADPLGWFLSGPTNLAFGGPGLRQVAVANLASRHLSLGSLGVAGHPLNHPEVR